MYSRVHVILMTFGRPISPEHINRLKWVFEEGYQFTVTPLKLSLTTLSADVQVNDTLSRFQDFEPDDLLLFYYMGHGHISPNMRFIMSANASWVPYSLSPVNLNLALLTWSLGAHCYPVHLLIGAPFRSNYRPWKQMSWYWSTHAPQAALFYPLKILALLEGPRS